MLCNLHFQLAFGSLLIVVCVVEGIAAIVASTICCHVVCCCRKQQVRVSLHWLQKRSYLRCLMCALLLSACWDGHVESLRNYMLFAMNAKRHWLILCICYTKIRVQRAEYWGSLSRNYNYDAVIQFKCCRQAWKATHSLWTLIVKPFSHNFS